MLLDRADFICQKLNYAQQVSTDNTLNIGYYATDSDRLGLVAVR